MRIHGRNGMVYVSLTNGTAATPIAFQSDWTMSFVVAKIDVTAMGDANLIWVPGLPDASGDFNGWYDDSTSQSILAAIDGLSRNFYLYPNRNTPQYYFFGTIFPDFAATGGVSKAVDTKATWKAASAIQRFGPTGLGS